MKSALILCAALLVLTACSDGEQLASCRGPIFQLNANHWQATPAELTKPATASD